MSSNKIVGLRGRWRGALLAAFAPGMLLAFLAGCNKTKAADAADADVAAADADGGTTEVTPPAPVVAGDPDIPLNEAVVGTAPVPADYAADTAPPAPVTEEQPASPEQGDVWVPGYWWWSVPFHRYVWVSGAWRNPPPDQVWTPGNWVSNPEGKYVWVPGFWGAAGCLARRPSRWRLRRLRSRCTVPRRGSGSRGRRGTTPGVAPSTRGSRARGCGHPAWASAGRSLATS